MARRGRCFDSPQCMEGNGERFRSLHRLIMHSSGSESAAPWNYLRQMAKAAVRIASPVRWQPMSQAFCAGAESVIWRRNRVVVC